MTSVFVIRSAYIDLYNPGALEAKQYYDYAIMGMAAIILVALPLWIEKIKHYKAWLKVYDRLDDDQKRIEYNKILKPIIKQAILVIVLSITSYFIINHYYCIPDDVINNYQSYYSNKIVDFNISGINITD